MIKYIGSKRALLPAIVDVIGNNAGATTVLDLFSGTSRVGHALKGRGFGVIANDHNAYAHCLARCYVEANREDVERDATKLIRELNKLRGKPGWFTKTFCEDARFFQPKNGARVDAIRDSIKRRDLEPVLESVLLVSLMEAADRVDSTVGVQMAYLKEWAARSFNDLELRMPDVQPRSRPCKALRLDALDAVKSVSADVAYVDPPYNQHSYLGNYHVWESLVLWDKPEVYGVAKKRVDVKTRKSKFNFQTQFDEAMRHLVENVDAKALVVSFNNEGFAKRDDLEALLAKRGDVRVVELDHKRYVGARIGIYNPKGEKVGAVSHVKNVEYLYVVGKMKKLRKAKSAA